MSKEKESVVRKAMMVFDAFTVSVAFLVAYFIRQHFHTFYNLDIIPSIQVVSGKLVSLSDYLVVLILVVLLWCSMLYFNGMYNSIRMRKLFEVVWIIAKSSFFTTIAFGAFSFLLKIEFVSRIFFAIFLVVSAISLLLEKIAVFSVIHYVRKHGYDYRRILIVGTGRRAADVISKTKSHPEWGLKILGVINDDPSRNVEKVKDVEVIGNLNNISEILHKGAVDEVIFVVPRSRLSHIDNAVYACETEGVKATIAVDLFDLRIAKSYQTALNGIPLITYKTTVADERQLLIKSIMDFVISGFGIILLSPLLLFVSVLIKLTSSGPIFFKQRRIGLNGREFVLYKFRTMYKDAEKQQKMLETLNEMDGPVFKIRKDPRITPVGRLLRKFSIDELPQLFNVFIGHMSLIGPRPPLPNEVIQYETWQRRRLSMRPGITCLWQISGRNEIDFEEWMRLDLEYLDNWSLWIDIKILVKTIPAVLFGSGAY